MRNFYIAITIVFVFVIGFIGVFYLTQKEDLNDVEPSNDLRNDFQQMDLRLEFIPLEGVESQEIHVLNEDDEIIFNLTIDELNQWTRENWDIFEEAPEVGGRPVEPDNFGFFDRAASISDDNKKMVFSVSDYAVAMTTSFVIVADIRSGDLVMINEPTQGSAEEYYWSKDNNLIAYTTGTGRAAGDFLLVDDVKNFERKFILREDELLEVLDPDEEMFEVGQFMPIFQNLQWSEDRLFFTTEHPENGQLRWSINKDGANLKKVTE